LRAFYISLFFACSDGYKMPSTKYTKNFHGVLYSFVANCLWYIKGKMICHHPQDQKPKFMHHGQNNFRVGGSIEVVVCNMDTLHFT